MSNLSLIPVGSVIESAYYTVPGFYDPGEHRYPVTPEGLRDACKEAHAKWEDAITSVIASWRGMPEINGTPVEEYARAITKDNHCLVDLRWVLRAPEGHSLPGSTDTVIERKVVSDLDDVHWECMARIGVLSG